MKEQLSAAIGTVTRPRSALAGLPHDRIHLLAVVAPLYFGYARASRQGSIAILAESMGSRWGASLLVLAVGLAVLSVAAVVLKGVVRLFGKRLTIRKVINLVGYASVPRFLVAIPASIYFLAMSDAQRAAVLVGQPTPLSLTFTILGIVALFYGLVLLVMGLVWSTGVDESNAEVPDEVPEAVRE